MAREVGERRRGGIGGYFSGFLAGIALVALVLVALAVVAPLEEVPDSRALAELEVEGQGEAPREGAPLATGGAEDALRAEGEGEVVVEAEPDAEPDPAPEEPSAPDEELATAPVLEPVAPDLGEAPQGPAVEIDPVEVPELPGELPADTGQAAVAPGGADEIPPELETILEGAMAEESEDELAADVDRILAAEQEGQDDTLAPGAADFPPPLPETRPIELSGPALSVNAASYAAPDDQPLVGVVFDATGASELSPDVLFALPVPATLGIVPGREGDEALARLARSRDWEVVAQLPVDDQTGEAMPGALAPEMPPEEVAERTEALMGRLSQAIAAASSGGQLEDPAAVRAVLEALQAHGFAYIGAGAAGAGGPPNVEPTRIVPRDATAEEVRAALEEAASAAGPQGAALVVLPPTRVAAEALAQWNAGQGAGRIAPLSAVIRRQTGG